MCAQMRFYVLLISGRSRLKLSVLGSKCNFVRQSDEAVHFMLLCLSVGPPLPHLSDKLAGESTDLFSFSQQAQLSLVSCVSPL